MSELRQIYFIILQYPLDYTPMGKGAVKWFSSILSLLLNA